jgi:hypothetical protein
MMVVEVVCWRAVGELVGVDVGNRWLVGDRVGVVEAGLVGRVIVVEGVTVVGRDQVLSGRSHTSALAMLATRLESLPSALVDDTR